MQILFKTQPPPLPPPLQVRYLRAIVSPTRSNELEKENLCERRRGKAQRQREKEMAFQRASGKTMRTDYFAMRRASPAAAAAASFPCRRRALKQVLKLNGNWHVDFVCV